MLRTGLMLGLPAALLCGNAGAGVDPPPAAASSLDADAANVDKFDPTHTRFGFEMRTRWGQRIRGTFPEFEGEVIELPSDWTLDDWPQYVNQKEFGVSMPVKSPSRAMEVFRADFDAAWRHGGLWAAIWHPFVSGRLARAEAMVELIEHMQGKGDVWFATMAEIGAHIDGLVERREWSPSVERLPFWREPVPQIVRPTR